MRVLACLVAATLLAGGCTGGGPELAADPEKSPLATVPATTSAPPASSDPPDPTPEGCHALHVYLANGGFSDDDTYDPTTDTLIVYGVGREFLLTPRDADCIADSPEIRRRVRDALGAYDDNVEGDIHSELLDAALS